MIMGGGSETKRAAASRNSETTPVANKFPDANSLVRTDENNQFVAPIISAYNERIRPLLDAVDKLRLLNVIKEGIQLPTMTIVLVGDLFCGKSSVLESLAGISLSHAQGVRTRVPLIMRIQNQQTPKPQLFLEFNGKTVITNEERVELDIQLATEEIAGSGNGVSNVPLTLVVRKNGVPDLTMVDLPGIRRHTKNFYDQIRDMIMEYIKPEENIILNVISAIDSSFNTSESIMMSKQVDSTGVRTLAVVTMADEAPDGFLNKVSADEVNIDLGYFCVRNRVGDESFEDAQREEAELFRSHPMLSEIDKTIVGIPVLAQRLMQIQARGIGRCLHGGIVRNIDQKLNANAIELEKVPRDLTSEDATAAFMRIIGSAKESLRKILLQTEIDEYPDDKAMHCSPRLVEMLNNYSDELLHKTNENGIAGNNFLMEEIKVLEGHRQIALPDFLPPMSAFLFILRKNIDKVSNISTEFFANVWDYLEQVILTLLNKRCEDYYSQLQLSASRPCHKLMVKMKERCSKWVKEMLEMEKLTCYTCVPDYVSELNKLKAHQQDFIYHVCQNALMPDSVVLGDLGTFRIAHLRTYSSCVLSQAYVLKMSMLAYWKIVSRRVVDSVALNLQYNLHSLVDKDMEVEIVKEFMTPPGGGIQIMLQESPAIAEKREKLKMSIKFLKESKDVVANFMDV